MPIRDVRRLCWVGNVGLNLIHFLIEIFGLRIGSSLWVVPFLEGIIVLKGSLGEIFLEN